jgi:quinol-cytochrome oxidoreductase complex cytochrome b subunit
MSRLGSAHNWLEERLGWDELIAPLQKKSVPMHRLSYWYFLGGICCFCITGRERTKPSRVSSTS